jgi:hypothetical protein
LHRTSAGHMVVWFPVSASQVTPAHAAHRMPGPADSSSSMRDVTVTAAIKLLSLRTVVSEVATDASWARPCQHLQKDCQYEAVGLGLALDLRGSLLMPKSS